jgi:hypothetical protein
MSSSTKVFSTGIPVLKNGGRGKQDGYLGTSVPDSGVNAYPALYLPLPPYLLLFSGGLLVGFWLFYALRIALLRQKSCKNIQEYSDFWLASGCHLLKSGRNLAVFLLNSFFIFFWFDRDTFVW